MALFEVPGWTIPSAPKPQSSTKSKKRKLHSQDAQKVESAAVNIDKLIASLGNSETSQAGPKKSKRKRKDKHEVESPGKPGESAAGTSNGLINKSKKLRTPGPKEEEGKEERVSKKRRKVPEKAELADRTLKHAPPMPKNVGEPPIHLTPMQAQMKQSLNGARFRWINETMYKSPSEDTHKMIREQPSIFTEYHVGFRHQVQSWPSNPVSHYISSLSNHPAKTVIVDLGCGDATLARTLVPKGFTILSYDLVSDNEFVIEADICSRIPLPGSELSEGDGGQVVDVVVCALSLMGTNWPKCIREAWRVLRKQGELRIAEVASRMTDVGAFVSLVSSVGFKLQSKDESNSHFTLFLFSKVVRREKTEKEWNNILAKSDVLKPCEYKRR